MKGIDLYAGNTMTANLTVSYIIVRILCVIVSKFDRVKT